MAKLPGLTRQDDRPSVGGTSRGRVQVRNPIGTVGLQPQARPIDTYSRPQAPDSGADGLMQLASALSSVSPAIQGFLQQSQDKAKKDAEDRANKRIGGMSFEEARAAVDNGSIPEMENPWFKAAYMKQYGERLAYQRINELTTEYETNFDKDQGSFDQFVRERAKEDLEKYGNDPHFTSAYNQLIDNYNAKANQAQAQHRAEQTKLDTVSGVYDTFMGQAQAMRQEGKSAEEIVTALRSKFDGNRQLLHVDYREQDKEMVRLAESYAAQGDLEMVRAILNGDRTGSDGTKLGPLAANREFQADAVRILNAAESRLEENNGKAAFDNRMTYSEQARAGKLDQAGLMALHKAKPGTFSDAQVLSLIDQNNAFNEQQAALAAKNEQRMALAAQARASQSALRERNMGLVERGRLAYLEDATVLTDTGETKTLSVEEQRKDVVNEIKRQSDWLIENKQATPDQVFDREVKAFTANNLVNPEWSSILSAGRIGSTPFTNSGGELPVQLRDGAELYLRLHNANPALLDSHIKKEADRDFYETFRIATQYGKLGFEQALQTATMKTSDPERAQAMAKVSNEEVEERVRDITYGGNFLGFGASSPSNRGYVAAEIGRLGKFYAANGLDADDALDEAKARFEATHTAVNGNFVYTAGKNIPPNFGEMATRAIEKYAKEYGLENGGYEAEDLTIRPATNGNGWLIVDSLTQLPVDNSAKANLTLRSLQAMEDERLGKVKAEIVEQQERTRKDVEAGISPLDRIIPPVRGGPFTGDLAEAIRKRDEEDRKAAGGEPAEEKPGKSFFDTIIPPVRGGFFSGSTYEEINRPQEEQPEDGSGKAD